MHSSRPKHLRFVEVFLIGLIILHLTVYQFMWRTLLSTSTLRRLDFLGLYSAGHLARMGEFGKLYDLDAEYAIQREVIGPSFSPDMLSVSQHPPFLSPLLATIACDDYTVAYRRWTIVLIIALATVGIVLAKFLMASGWESRLAIVSAVSYMCFYPTFVSILHGQDTVFTLLFLLIWMVALLQHREVLAGFGLALATLSPQVTGALSVPLIASRRAASWWFGIGAGLLAIWSLVLIGWQGARDLLGLLRSSASGQGAGVIINQRYMSNLLGLLLRNVPGLDPGVTRLLAWGIALLSLNILCCLWWGKRTQLTVEHVGLAVVTSVVTAPHLHGYSLAFLLPSLLGFALILRNRGDRGEVAALVLVPVSSLLMMFGHILGGDLWFYRVAYILMAVLIVGLLISVRQNSFDRRLSPASPINGARDADWTDGGI